MKTDRRVIACNYGEPVGAVATGALCYVVNINKGNASERVQIWARSRSGRWINKWENLRRLTNFRLKTIPPEHPRYADRLIADYCSQEDVDLLNRSAQLYK